VTIKDISRAIRTRQWAKNALLFGGFIFAGGLRAPWGTLFAELTRVLLAFVCFCALSGAAYLINDWQDLERDRLHPTKKNRPLAAGRISLRGAAVLLAVLLGCALFAIAILVALPPHGIGFAAAALTYFVLTLAYSFKLKHEVIIDVLSVAAGFVVRVVAGCLAIPVEISPWILFCTFTLALFIALCKRRAELLEVGEGAGTRHVLKGYTPEMLDTFIAIAACLTIIAYSLYTFNAPHTSALGPNLNQTPLLMTSIPFVVYGVFRYLLLAHSSPVGGEPEQMLRDKPLMTCVLLWGFWVAFLTLLPII
jgi:4-hydroxybenzoate polyprenyltransferase